jgi:hypothetical protein
MSTKSSVNEDRYKSAGGVWQRTQARRGRLRGLQRISKSIKIKGLSAKDLMVKRRLLRQEVIKGDPVRVGLAVNRDHQR